MENTIYFDTLINTFWVEFFIFNNKLKIFFRNYSANIIDHIIVLFLVSFI